MQKNVLFLFLLLINSFYIHAKSSLDDEMRICVTGGMIKEVERILSEGYDINDYGNSGSPPLYWAASCDNTKMVEFLISKGAKVNLKDRSGYTPLHNACIMNSMHDKYFEKYIIIFLNYL